MPCVDVLTVALERTPKDDPIVIWQVDCDNAGSVHDCEAYKSVCGHRERLSLYLQGLSTGIPLVQTKNADLLETSDADFHTDALILAGSKNRHDPSQNRDPHDECEWWSFTLLF